MNLKLYRLKFRSSFHSGDREGFLESAVPMLHSDTIFSAFCHSYWLLYGDAQLTELLDSFIENKPVFLLSSAFPWIKEKIYFPVPLNQFTGDKKLKKISFVEKKAFEQLLAGKTLQDISIYDRISEGKPWVIQSTPRIALNRLTNSPGENYFHFGEVFFNSEDSGLFFIVRFPDESFIKNFQSTLNLMADEGIGGDRTVGKGFFNVQCSDIELVTPKNTNSIITVSLVHPKDNEIFNLKDGYYEIMERRGYIFSYAGRSLRKKSVRMISEASVFPSNLTGDMVDLTPEIFKQHRVYRYGFCLSLPCKLREENED